MPAKPLSASERSVPSATPCTTPSATPSAPFGAAMQRLDALQQLRYSDPALALKSLMKERTPLRGTSGAEQALLLARVAMQVASAHVVLGEHTLAQPQFERMLAQLRTPALVAATGDMQRHAQRCAAAGANARAVLAHALGDMAGALAAYMQALDLVRDMGERRHEAHVLVNLANTFEESGLPAQALEHLRLALDLASREGMAELLGDIHHNIGNALAATGEHAAGLASNQRALQAYTQLSLPQKQRYAWVAIAERLLELEQPAQAQDALTQRAALPEDYTNQQYQAYAAYLAGRIAFAQGDVARANTALQSAKGISASLADPVGQSRALMAMARWALDCGANEEAAALAQEALSLLAPTAAHRDQMQAHDTAYRAALAQGQHGAALRHHQHFHEAYARCVNGESATKARLLAVQHEVDMVRAEARHQQLENARLTEALAHISARLAGAPTAPGALQAAVRPEDLQPLGLTPREAEVLYWVTQGKTNEDVATILSASLSTVKKHLASVYRKLGVENRTAAANRARQRVQGLVKAPV